MHRFIAHTTIAALATLPVALAQSVDRAQDNRQTSSDSAGTHTNNQRLGFDSLPPGTIVSSIFSDRGIGPVLVNGVNPALGGENAAVVFDSANPTGEDPDLGTPNEDFGGPGVGDGGAAGSPFENSMALNHVLIIGEDLVDADMDGLVDDPDDADLVGSLLEFDFTAVAPVVILGMAILDIEQIDESANVEFFDENGTMIDVVDLPMVGDNGAARVAMSVPGVFRMRVMVNGSGAIDNIFFAPPEPSKIGDRVWCDLDNDGVLDFGEPGIADVTVRLACAGPDGMLGTPDDLTATTTTDPFGRYIFLGLEADLCEVTVDETTVPDDKVRGECPGSFTVDLEPGESFLDADFCFITPGEIGDLVYCDIDFDGMRDPGEPGIPGATVNLRCAGPDNVFGTPDDLLSTTTTNSDGMYLFVDLPPGRCQVTVDPTTVGDKVPGACPQIFNVILMPGQSFLDADFCFIFEPGRIGDLVYCDEDNDGERDPGEPGLPNVVVNLTCAGIDGVLGTADDVTDTTMTDTDGAYLFTGVPARQICVVRVDPTTAPPGKIPGGCPADFVVELEPGELFDEADFCFRFPDPGTIGDTVYCDIDNDGIQDLDEPGIPGVTVDLLCAGFDGTFGTPDDFADTRVTDDDGMYLFTGVTPGDCRVTVDVSTAPPDKVPGICPLMFEIDLPSGGVFLDADFCFIVPPGQIGDLVYCDEDNDGMRDPGEPGIPGAVVTLVCAGPDGTFGTPDDFTDIDVTDMAGAYLFTGVPAGACRVAVDPTTVGEKLPGSCPLEFEIDLPSGGSFLDADFCFVTPGEIGDFVWCDLDDDGNQDLGEPGIAGVGVEVVCAGPDGVIGTADDFSESTTTNDEGSYLIRGIPPGPCRVTVILSSVPPDKTLGQCPPEITLVLAPAESFLDADFCFVFNPQDCCENGKPRRLTMLYTGEDCSATSHTQDPDKVSCDGDPGFAPTVFIRSTDKENPFDTGGKIWFEGLVDITTTYVIDATLEGEDRLGSKTFVHIFDPSGSTLLQTVEFHTSCSQPLSTGNQFGASLLVDCEGENDPIDGDCCAFGRPRVLTMQYTGDDCTATSHAQDPDKVSCDGDPNSAPNVFIRSTDKENPFDVSGRIWFSGNVDLDATFDIDAAGEDHLRSETFVHIFDTTGTTLLQTIEFHTSCSQPLLVGNQFGAALLIDCIGEDEPIEGDCCAFGRPRVLTMEYTGDDCTATTHSQDPNKVSCSGDPASAPTVFVRANKNENPFNTDRVWFEGLVDLGATFDIDAANEGRDHLESETWVHFFDSSGTTLLQSVEFHTSCSQPLFVGNQFGAALLIDCIGEDQPDPNAPFDSCDDGRPQVLTMRYTGEDCSFTNHSQDPGKVSCMGDPAFATPVFIRSTNKEDPNDTGGRIWFEGQVQLDGLFDIDATAEGENRLPSATFVHIFDSSGSNLLQTIEFHTSCSQPLMVGNQFGAIVLEVFTPEP
ncbi:MAG: hypothetical protein GY711_08185 [bacterium]|nr:hypothetical protein [bacterium]